ncbi:MAG TPA: hypothetical protein VE264_02795 [Nitrososphaera sp.]|nr:hypothetical protein [Nitrososphaera sp.]
MSFKITMWMQQWKQCPRNLMFIMYVEPHVVIMNFRDGKIAYEHIYWDQASLLVQIGLLDPKLLPVIGQEQAKRLLELSHQADNTNRTK